MTLKLTVFAAAMLVGVEAFWSNGSRFGARQHDSYIGASQRIKRTRGYGGIRGRRNGHHRRGGWG